MAIEHFGKEVVKTVFHGMKDLAKEQKAHAMMNRDGLCHGLESAVNFVSAHPLILAGTIATAALIKVLASDD